MQNAKLLIVIADDILAEITIFRLELLGYEVRLAASGEQALAMLKDQQPDLFLIDLELPGISGTALIEQLASETNTAQIPVLAISLSADLELVQRTIGTGATDYLVVPYDPLILEEKVAKSLAVSSQTHKTEKHLTAKA